MKERNLAWVSMNLDPLAATKMSQARAISNPAVTANPLMAPIIGLRHRSICTTVSVSASFTSPLNTSSADVRSTPEQNERPDPVNIITRAESSRSRLLKAWARSTIIGRVSELRESGRLIVTVAMPFGSRVTSISFSCDNRSMFDPSRLLSGSMGIIWILMPYTATGEGADKSTRCGIVFWGLCWSAWRGGITGSRNDVSSGYPLSLVQDWSPTLIKLIIF